MKSNLTHVGISLKRLCGVRTVYSIAITYVPPILVQGSPVEILPHLFLGSAHHASQKEELKALGITALINASSSCENLFEAEFRYKRIPVEDTGSADISSWFDDVIAFISTYSPGVCNILIIASFVLIINRNCGLSFSMKH